jgi:formyl-CoA transferase
VASSHSFAFRCADGKLLALQLSSQSKFWDGLLTTLARPDLGADPRFASREQRIKNYVALTQALAEVFVNKSRLEWMNLLEASDVPFAPVHTIADVLDDAQVKHLQTFRTLQHPTEGAFTTIRRPVHIDGDRDGSDLPAPTLGEHTEVVLKELGYDDAAIADMRSAKAI